MAEFDENGSVPDVAPGRVVLEQGEARTPEAFRASFEIGRVPVQAGCYIMQDQRGAVVYVGKAKNLRARMRQYLSESDERYHVQFLMRRVAQIDFLVTSNEKEALLLENSLIKQHKPRYNFRLKDDKTYVRVRVDVQHAFPRLTITRNVRKDGARYFGPYSDTRAVRDVVRQLQRLFPLRTCSDAVLASRERPCLYHQMGQCAAPCVDLVSSEDYREIVQEVVLILEGKRSEVERRLLERIQRLADALEFEQAAVLRDRLYALRKTLERQRTVQAAGENDRDVFGVYTQGRYSQVQALFYRGGALIGGRTFSFSRHETATEEMLGSLLLQYYADNSEIPPEVLLPLPIEEAETLEEILSETRGARVTVACPQRGEKRRLVELAERNARSSFEERRLADKANADLLEQMRTALGLSNTPHRIECFDISTTQGDKPVGSMVTFEDGAASKQRYRRFAIRQVEGQDDFAMMREMLLRRYRRAVDENDLPDLVLIDGGKGQLNVAVAALSDLGVEDLEVASIAKSRAEGDGRSPERFFRPGRKNPIILPQNHAVVLLLARIRDEAHRFAVTYHRKRRSKAAFQSSLLEIPGVGRERARRLLKTLGSLAAVKAAPVEEIARVPGVGENLARTIKEHLERRATERRT